MGLKKWFADVRNLFRRLMGRGVPFNIYHPDLEEHIEAAFVCGMTTYYRFKKDHDMPVGRYKWVHNFLYEVDLRMSIDVLNAFIDELTTNLSGKKGQINLTDAVVTLTKMKSRAKLGFEVETVKKLASVVYFTDKEILNTYDRKEGRDKIAYWDANGNLDFFLTRPVNELLKLKDISLSSLEEYVQWQQGVLKDLMPQVPGEEKEPQTSKE